MKLIKVGCAGYKRFREKAEMDVDTDLVAIVGPNEAGKTSLLEALAFFESERPLAPSETTRGSTTAPMVWARYLLEAEDLEAVANIPEARAIRQCTLTRTGDAERQWQFEPDVVRDFEPRRKAARRLKTLLEYRPFRDLEPDDDLVLRANSLLNALDSSKEYLNQMELNLIDEMAEGIRAADAGKQADAFAGQLDALHKHESAEHPFETAANILENRRPPFLYFEEDARDLRSSYSFDEEPNTALHNLLGLAETSWGSLAEAAGEPGRIEGLEEAANQRLREAFRAWQQFEMRVRLRIADNTVHLLVNRVTPHDYIGISERSAGLRQFVALRAHIAAGGRNTPILLVDEAELHLHYDAQADLIDVFSTQTAAAKVIYTTHSAGCLPPDLGLGIRIVLPARRANSKGELRDTDDSEIINWFWASQLEGSAFNPILIGMGASTFAFSAMRRAVIGEGPTDAILLPTLFREVARLDKLDFQVAPGLSNISAEGVKNLDLVAARVVHLVDSDTGGGDIEKLLLENGVLPERILRLAPSEEECVLEDLLEAQVYLDAVNAEIQRWRDGAPEMPPDALTATRRPRAVDTWCEEHRLASPGRRAVAHRVLDQRKERKLVASNHRSRLKKLHRDIEKRLDKQ